MSEPAKILVVEDDDDIRLYFEHCLSRMGFDVRAAPDGLAGLQAIDEFEPELVLLNYQMPRMNGLEMMVELSRRRPAGRPRVILMTGARYIKLEHVQPLGMIDVVHYPVSSAVLSELVLEALDPALDVPALMRRSRRRHAASYYAQW